MTGKNYTRPNDPEHNDDPQDWLNNSLIFARALGVLFKDKEGICVELRGDMHNPVGDAKRIVVFRLDDKIHIDDATDDLVEGDFIQVEDRSQNA